ncbi:MAG: exodeoxyribonuclease VII large subunit [Candidatus Eisenbacteria sp.]|nr:exodeoxyribonuclease VII large subunit [Candidatus Eisenbacteria bacterium]
MARLHGVQSVWRVIGLSEIEAERVYTVSELNRDVRALVEETFPSVWVEGEIANYVHHTSGHMYFSLRDETAQLRGVMFRGCNRRLRFEPENGLHVLARGGLSIYERGGQYQMIIDLLQPAGIGSLELAFQQIRRKLEAEGLFDPEHKRPIPAFPLGVGIATSPTGAAIRDIVHVIGRRAPWVEIVLRPTQVQGEGAAEDIACAVRELNEFGDLDVLIVGRGGGSAEDLWAFNEEVVARSVFESEIPVISAVGHEIDYTISDLAADLRAPTPSAAAEVVTPDGTALKRDIARLQSRLVSGIRNRLRMTKVEFCSYGDRWKALRFEMGIGQMMQRPDELLNRLVRRVGHAMELSQRELGALAARLNGVSPLAVLGRGYCLCRKLPGMAVVTRASCLTAGDEILLRFHEGETVCSVEEVRDSEESPQ